MNTSNSIAKHILAFLCRICPFCICARYWPESRYAKAHAKIERSCPACRAYAELNKGLKR